MKTEETILNYMDGTLDENESGELLHQLSVSPEKRVVLEQHIKLRELTSLAQKPAAVPQALEARMAERFPAIAEYNRELSGGAVFIKQSAPNFIGRMATSVAAFIAQYPIRTGFAVATASVIAYFTLSSSPKTEVAVNANTNSAQIQSVQNSGGVNANNSVADHATNLNSSSSFATANAAPSTNSLSSKSERTFARHSVNHVKNNSSAANNETIMPDKQDATPKEKINTPEKSIADDNNGTSNNNGIPANDGNQANEKQDNNKQVNDNPAKENTIKDTPKKDDAPKAIADSKPASNANEANVGSHTVNPLKSRDEHPANTGLAIRVFEGFGSALVNAHANDATLASKTEFTPSVGIDNSFDPNFSVGIEAGSAAISQLLTQSSLQPAAGDLPISRVVTNNSVTASSQIYGRVMVRYTLNPYDDWRFEVSGGGGAAFASKAAPLISGAVLVGHNLIGSFAVYGGVALSGTWTSANAQNTIPPITSTGDPIGYVTVNHASATLFTPSVSARIGFKYNFAW
jgi:hypothetical protein